MKHATRLTAAVLAAILVSISLFAAACDPANSVVLATTPEPTVSPTATPIPTSEPTPTPRVIEFSIERSLAESTTDAEIIFHHLTYTKNQDMVLTLTVSNHTDKFFILLYPIYANINGYGVLFTAEDKNETLISSTSDSETEVSLSAKLDETMDSLMSIEQIESAQFECIFVLKGETIRGISDVFVNAECPEDYVQPYNKQGDKLEILVSPDYYSTGINNDIQISSFYSDLQKRIYLTLAGTTPDGNTTRGEVADFGFAYLAINGVVTPCDDNVNLTNGEELYLPNNGYCVVSFDVSHVPDFDYAVNDLSFSFRMFNNWNVYTTGFFSALLRTGSNASNNVFSNYSNQGEIWIDEYDFQFIYRGSGKNVDGNFYFDGNLINKTQSETIVYVVDIFVNKWQIQIISDPVPPGCVLQMHSIQSSAFYTGGDLKVTISIFGVGAKLLSKTTKTIQLVDE